MNRTAFFISDSTGITAETLGQSLLAQFDNIAFDKIVLPFVDTAEKARRAVDKINDAARRVYHAVPARALAELSVEIAAETDAKVASLPPDRLSPRDPDSPLYAERWNHRAEHLDEIEAALTALRSR